MEFRIQSALEASGYSQESTEASTYYASGGKPEEPKEPQEPQGPPEEVRMLGRYQVLGRLGRGGMGEVLRGRDPETGLEVAIKLLDAAGYEDEDLLKRFEREAEAVREIEHQNIARFYGLERDEHNLPFIVMEYIAGQSLDKLVKNNPDLPLSRIIYFMAQAARGLEFARRRAVIHRDVKPANLLVMPDDRLKIIDFGLAKSLWEQSVLTNTGMVLGTARYIAPEQALGKPVDHRADLYSLGASFYELVTGEPPFDAETPAAIMVKHINVPLIPPIKVNPRLPIEVNDIIMRMMAKDPRERYPDYETLIRDLESARIQQMSKEKRLAEEKAQADAPTMLLDEDLDLDSMGRMDGGATDSRRRPSPYLSEGIVQVEYREEEPPPPRSRLVLYTLIGAVLLAGAGVLYLREKSMPASERRADSGIAHFVSSLVGGRKVDDPTPAELAWKDREMIDETAERMDVARVKVLRYAEEKLSPGETPLIRRMREDESITIEESQDAWGNDFYITREEGLLFLKTAGRDNIDGSQDDFRISVDGARREFPGALSEEYFLQKRGM